MPADEGYQAHVVGDHNADPDELVARVQARLRADVGRLHLKPAPHRPGEWILKGDAVHGRLIWSGDGRGPYSVVVDGRTLTWEEFGSVLEPFEGFRFRLLMEADE